MSDTREWRRFAKFRLWMPVTLQCLLIVALFAYTEHRFDGDFVNKANITTVVLLAMPLALASMAQTHALLVGYLDLSVGAMISFGVVIGSFLIDADASPLGIAFGIAVVLAAGLGLGLVNALLIRGFKIPSLIATLATLSILDGISLTMRPTAQGVISGDLVSWLRKGIGPIPIAFIVIFLGAALLDVWLHGSESGLRVRAVGFDDRAAQRGGINSIAIRVRALILSSVIAAIAALFVMARSPIGNAQIGGSFALNSITAAVLGGAALAGGRATFVGSTVGAVLLALIITALPFLGLQPTDGPMIIGLLVLLGIVLFQVQDLKQLAQRNLRKLRRLTRDRGATAA
jgi:ribose transport system ATP-binding protein